MRVLFFVLIPVIIAALPLFGARFIPTHDGEYHIIRFWQYYTMLADGNWFPRWAPQLNHGLGIPLFTFQYPLPNLIGSIFHFFGLSFVDSVKWTIGTGYILANIFSFFWMRRLFGAKIAGIAAVAGAFVPYWFIDIYIRGSVGEVWAFVFVFASFLAVAARSGLGVAAATALLIVSHNIMAVLFIPIILLYAGLTRTRLVVSVGMGVLAASYFWIPALFELRFIRGLSNVNIFDYFPQVYQLLIPSWGSGYRGQISGGNEMSYQIGIVPLLLAGFTAMHLIKNHRIPEKKEVLLAFWALVIAVFFMTPFSRPLWQSIPYSHLIQYPWRLLSVVLVMTPVLAGFVAAKFRLGWLVSVLAVVVAYGYSRPVTYEPRTDAYYLSHESLSRGTSSLGNAFQTTWLTGDAAVVDTVAVTSGQVRVNKRTSTVWELSINATGSGILTVPVAYYPGWQLSAADYKVPGAPDSRGLLTFPVYEGAYTAVMYLGLTPWQAVAAVVSVLSLLTAAVSFILKK